jgi:hypothetical protein
MIMSRRTCLAALAGSAAFPMAARASAPIDISWPDLLPAEANFSSMEGIVQHGAPTLRYSKEQGQTLTHAYDGKTIRMPGFILPTEFDGTAVRNFLLVPYVGACLHVPPPPPNQMVFVNFEEGFEGASLFAAVRVTGTLVAGVESTALAPVGYTLSADHVENYKRS